MEKPIEPAGTAQPGEIAEETVDLQDIDRILTEDDPAFVQSLGQINEKIDPTGVDLEPEKIGDESLSTENDYVEKPSLSERFPKLKYVFLPFKKIGAFLMIRWLKMRSFGIALFRQSLVWIQTRPKEYVRYSIAMVKALWKLMTRGLQLFLALSVLQKIILFVALTLSVLALGMLWLNIGGIWIPGFWQGPLTSLEKVADNKWSIIGEPRLPLYPAFPQKQFKYEFRKMVVNLRPTPSHPNPMGYFEFYVDVDSEPTAVEVRSRENALHDIMQRTVEGFTYNELELANGKERMKVALVKELNAVLNQGWVNEVLIKTIVIKP